MIPLGCGYLDPIALDAVAERLRLVVS